MSSHRIALTFRVGIVAALSMALIGLVAPTSTAGVKGSAASVAAGKFDQPGAAQPDEELAPDELATEELASDDLDESGPARDLVDPTGDPGFDSGLVERAKGKKRRYMPRRGVIFNNPIGSKPQQYRIYNKVIKSIQSAPRQSTIRVMSWNVFSRGAVRALLAAQSRGVKVKVLMDRDNVNKIPNPSWRNLVSGLRAGNARRPKKNHSRATTCFQSCRGKGGDAHSKYFLFSQTGRAKNVTMQGSFNLTAAASINQWNDIYTWVGNRTIYNFGVNIFEQMWKDRPRAKTFVRKDTPNGSLMFSPYGGKDFPGDPMFQILNNTRCSGAAKGYGTANGRTIVRVAPDVMRHARGMRMARRLKQMWDRGCDIKVAYTLLGGNVYRILKSGGPRGPIPNRHLIQDFDRDGDFDNYFHLKAFTINGRYKNNPRASIIVNGSSNMSGVGSTSDENIGIYTNRKLMKKYEKHITFWFDNQPRKSRETVTTARRTGIDPYRTVDLD